MGRGHGTPCHINGRGLGSVVFGHLHLELQIDSRLEVQPQVLYPHPRMAFATFSSAVRDPFLIASLGRPDSKRKKEEEKSIKDRSEPAAEALVRSHCRAPAHVVAARCDEKGRRETS
ncbi:hypothetical protein BHM03_00038629 [Ensete ventricosum]|nr:hypothetical protein BHM03_00038629 [Ensete ventricosum]